MISDDNHVNDISIAKSDLGSGSELSVDPQTKNNSEGITAEGRRIFDIQFLIQQLKTFGAHKSPYACSSTNMAFVKEYRRGLYSELQFKCNMCGAMEILKSDNTTNLKNMSVNEAMVRMSK